MNCSILKRNTADERHRRCRTSTPVSKHLKNYILAPLRINNNNFREELMTTTLYVFSSVQKPTGLNDLFSSCAKKANRIPPLRSLHTIITFRSVITINVITNMYGNRNCHSALFGCLWCALYH
jgi:hypothetical protein